MGNKQPVGAEPNFALQLSPEVRERMNVRLGFPRSPTEEQLRQGVDFERGRRMGQREAAWKAGYAHLQYVVGSEMDAASNLVSSRHPLHLCTRATLTCTPPLPLGCRA